MLLAEHRRHAALEIEARSLRTSMMSTTLAEDVHHAVSSTWLPERRPLAALDLEGQPLCQVSCEPTIMLTYTMPSSAYCLQNPAVRMPSKLKLCRLVQVSCE